MDQTSSSDFSSGEFSNSESSGTGTEASLQLKTSSSTQFGNSLKVEANSNFSLTSNAFKYSIRFTAQNTQSVSKVYLVVTRTGNPPTYRIGLQSDDGSSNHFQAGHGLAQQTLPT